MVGYDVKLKDRLCWPWRWEQAEDHRGVFRLKTGFCSPAGLSVIQPTMSKHWKKHKALT